jgi:hypothetical protein
MWRPFKQLLPKEHSGPSGGLEGRTIDVGNVKVHVREAIAEGGFSCVYLARDMANPAKQYALKHVIVRDRESLDLVQKEVTMMRSLKGHPNVVTLVAHAVLDMGHGREAFLLMEFCERSLVSALESRGVGFFDEEKVALIFRDVCNAVFAMHCQTPPIAHRSAFHAPTSGTAVDLFFTGSNSVSCIHFGAFVMNLLHSVLITHIHRGADQFCIILCCFIYLFHSLDCFASSNAFQTPVAVYMAIDISLLPILILTLSV